MNDPVTVQCSARTPWALAFFHTLLLPDKDTFHFPTFQCPLLGRR